MPAEASTTPTVTELMQDASEGSDVTGTGQHEEVTRRYDRSPQDVLRVIVFAAISATLLGLTIGLEDAVIVVEADIVELFGFVSPSIERVLHGGIEIVALLIGIGIYLTPLITRRYRLFGYIMLASLTSMLLMSGAQWVVDREASVVVVNELANRAGITGGTASGSIGLAQTSAVFIVLAPSWSGHDRGPSHHSRLGRPPPARRGVPVLTGRRAVRLNHPVRPRPARSPTDDQRNPRRPRRSGAPHE